MTGDLTPLNRVILLVAVYLVVLAGLPYYSYDWPELLVCLHLALVAMGPGAILCYGCVLIWRTRSDSGWQRITGLPLRGRWLCMFLVTLLFVASALILLTGVLFTAFTIWQALRY